MAKLLKRNEFLSINNKKFILNEQALENAIPWGDSLVGRLINSIARKAKINYNSLRMVGLTKQLRNLFDDMLELGQANISTEDLELLQIWTVFSELATLVQNEGEVSEMITVANKLVELVKKSGLDGKDEIVEKIQEFIEFLESIEDDSVGEGEGEDEDEDESEGEGDEGETQGADVIKTYPTLIKNLKSLSLILSQYQKNKSQRGVETVATEEFENIFYITKPNDTIESIQKLSENKFKWDADKIWNKNLKVLASYDEKMKKNPKLFGGNKFKMPLAKDLKIFLGKGKKEKGVLKEVTESYIFEETALKPGQLGVGGSEKRGEIKSGESHATQAFDKLKKDLDVMVSSKEKGIGIDSKFINEIVSKSNDTKNKNYIYSLYREVQRYLIGDKKATLQEREPLYKKESIEIIADSKKMPIVAEKIARFTKRAMQFEGENLYGSLGDIGKPLQDYVESMKTILKLNLKSKEESPKKIEKQVEPQNNSFVSSYNKFLSLILEKVSPDEIKTKFDEIFTEEIKTKLCPDKDKIEEYKKTGTLPGGTYVIRDTDPIISIIRLFQRAYRLHTPGQIPSGRKGGKVSVSVFNEYEYMGSGGGSGSADSPGGGPYRNIRLFDQWAKACNAILANAKYRPLFSDNTVFEFETKEQNKAGIGKGDKIKKGGKMFLRFFNKLNDNEMYRGGTSGSPLYQFYEEYFGLKLKEDDVAPTGAEKKQLKINTEVSDGVKTSTCEWVNIKDSGILQEDLALLFDSPDYENYEKLGIRFKVKTDDGDRTYFACVDKFLTNKTPKRAVIIFSTAGYPFDMTNIKLPQSNVSPTKNVYYGIIEKPFIVGRECKIKYMDIEDGGNENKELLTLDKKITEIKILVDSKDKKPCLDMKTRFVGKFSTFENNKKKAEPKLLRA